MVVVSYRRRPRSLSAMAAAVVAVDSSLLLLSSLALAAAAAAVVLIVHLVGDGSCRWSSLSSVGVGSCTCGGHSGPWLAMMVMVDDE
jgi:hypothetical protein